MFRKISVLNLRLDKVMFRPKRYIRKRIKSLLKVEPYARKE